MGGGPESRRLSKLTGWQASSPAAGLHRHLERAAAAGGAGPDYIAVAEGAMLASQLSQPNRQAGFALRALQAAATPDQTGHEVEAVLLEEVLEYDQLSWPRTWLISHIHQTYGHPLARYVSLAEHRSHPSTAASHAPQQAEHHSQPGTAASRAPQPAEHRSQPSTAASPAANMFSTQFVALTLAKSTACLVCQRPGCPGPLGPLPVPGHCSRGHQCALGLRPGDRTS